MQSVYVLHITQTPCALALPPSPLIIAALCETWVYLQVPPGVHCLGLTRHPTSLKCRVLDEIDRHKFPISILHCYRSDPAM